MAVTAVRLSAGIGDAWKLSAICDMIQFSVNNTASIYTDKNSRLQFIFDKHL